MLTKVDFPDLADNPATSLQNSHYLHYYVNQKTTVLNFTVISLFKETCGTNTKRLPAENPAERERSSGAERGCEDS